MTASAGVLDVVGRGRRAHLRYMPAIAARWTTSETSNGRGGQTRTVARSPWTWPAWAADRPTDLRAGWLPARLKDPTDDILAITANQYGSRPRWVLELPALTPIALEDIVAVADPSAVDQALIGTIGAIYSLPEVAGTAIATRALLVADQQGRTLGSLPS